MMALALILDGCQARILISFQPTEMLRTYKNIFKDISPAEPVAIIVFGTWT